MNRLEHNYTTRHFSSNSVRIFITNILSVQFNILSRCWKESVEFNFDLSCLGVTNVLKPFQLRRNTRSIPPPPKHRNALQINNLGNMSVPTHQIFWNKFPRNFTMFAAAKYVNYTGGYLISFFDSRDRLQIGIKVSKTSVALEYAQAGKRNQFLAFNVEVMDRKWHRFAFSVGNGLVSFYLDCQMIGTRNIAQANLNSVDRNGNAYLNAKAESPGEQNKNIKVKLLQQQ